MAGYFHAEPDPSTEILQEVAALAPENPFYAPAYAAAMGLSGEQPWALVLRDGVLMRSGCTGFLKNGRLNRWFSIPSLPALGEDVAAFWDGLFELCRRSRITHLSVNTYASTEASVPRNPVPARCSERIEYVIDLSRRDLWRPVRQSHRQRIHRGRKAGLHLRSSNSAPDCRMHRQMMGESIRRRERRGEEVSIGVTDDDLLVLLTTGAGVLFQAVLDDRVLSSALVLLCDRGAYDHSSGTCPEGMACGASQFLIFETAMHLRERGLDTLNLGGVSEANPGLHEFKAGFGAVRRGLASVEFDLRTGLRRRFEGAVRGLRNGLCGGIGPSLVQ